MEIKWQNTQRVKLYANGYYRLAYARWTEDGYKVEVQKKLWKNPSDFIFGKMIRRRGISYDVCIWKDRGWGWTHNLPSVKAVMDVVKNKQAESVSGF